jgi:decaprenyl-phosphate phosphoribosyltransferase
MSSTLRPPGQQARASTAPKRLSGDGAAAVASAILRTARPKQWLKNVLVFAAPAAGGVLFLPVVAASASWTAVVFTVASASTYFINDARDVEADRRHPIKVLRPVAAGRLSPRTAYAIGTALGLLAPALALPLGWATVGVVCLYLGITVAYSLWLKNQAVVDLLAVAAGFLLRAVAGGVATGVALSNWFLLVVLFGSLFLVTAKRSAEERRGGSSARVTLDQYPAAWLQQVLTMSMAGVVLTYATWALQYVGADVGSLPLALSVVPFLALMLRYSLLVARGEGEAPEELLTSDRFMVTAAVIWVALVGGALYLA